MRSRAFTIWTVWMSHGHPMPKVYAYECLACRDLGIVVYGSAVIASYAHFTAEPSVMAFNNTDYEMRRHES